MGSMIHVGSSVRMLGAPAATDSSPMKLHKQTQTQKMGKEQISELLQLQNEWYYCYELLLHLIFHYSITVYMTSSCSFLKTLEAFSAIQLQYIVMMIQGSVKRLIPVLMDRYFEVYSTPSLDRSAQSHRRFCWYLLCWPLRGHWSSPWKRCLLGKIGSQAISLRNGVQNLHVNKVTDLKI